MAHARLAGCVAASHAHAPYNETIRHLILFIYLKKIHPIYIFELTKSDLNRNVGL